MVELPSGTVTLLFSDIEGSTVLLSRLGPAYADALDGQRQALRKAWADHGGVELGTEGDSFMVVFPTAPDAVTAAIQAQRALVDYGWPGDEQVRVRMGIHTGNPQVHDGGYVGMDVHRAARIAGAAHGGQVVLSAAAAELVRERLPDRATLKDLGSHRLKDITNPEHVFQVAIEGLKADFPPLKTLGTASSLPRPTTPLVGRDVELADLSTLLASPQVRLVTLTGPGGSGKTRLAVGVAERLVDQFRDGVFFISLAAVTTAEVMWTSIAEVLDVPPEGRIPPGFFEHVAHRTAVFVLDNVEQVGGADDVVAELLEHGPQIVVIVTSRRPLNLAGELQHAVPPLELPEAADLDEVERSGAIQLFVQHAKAVKASFVLTASNAADMVEICRRLDGLPLAIELAAARTKLLSPSALLARLDKALDLASVGSRTPSRHKTLRDTIGWSYDLLEPTQQSLFRQLGVFAGGADLDAIATVCGDVLSGADSLDLVADLVDASLVTIDEDARGEPRLGMLETIRAYAIDLMAATGELDGARHDHACHFLDVAESWSDTLMSAGPLEQHLDASARLEQDHDNVRSALGWALRSGMPAGPSPDRARLAVKLCSAMADFWVDRGYYGEGRRWIEDALSVTADQPSVEVGRCSHALSHLLKVQGDTESARTVALRTVGLWRGLDAKDRLAHTLSLLAWLERSMGNLDSARRAAEEVVSLSRQTGDRRRLAYGLWHLAVIESHEEHFEHALELLNSAIDIHREDRNEFDLLDTYYTIACILRMMGRPHEALEQMRDVLPHLLRLPNPEMLVTTAEDYGAILADLNDIQHALLLLGSADAMRERIGAPREPDQQADIAEPYDKIRAAVTADDWERQYRRGRAMTVEDALTEADVITADATG